MTATFVRPTSIEMLSKKLNVNKNNNSHFNIIIAGDLNMNTVNHNTSTVAMRGIVNIATFLSNGTKPKKSTNTSFTANWTSLFNCANSGLVNDSNCTNQREQSHSKTVYMDRV